MTEGSDPGGRPQGPPPWQAPDPVRPAPAPQQPGPYQPPPYGPPPHQPPPGQRYPPGPAYGYPPGPGYGYPPAPRPGIIPLRPLALGDILDGTVKLIRSHPRATLGLSAIVGAVTGLPIAIGDAVLFTEVGSVFDGSAAPTAGEPPVGAMAAQWVGTGLGGLLTFVGTTIMTGLLTRVLGRAVFGGHITVGEAWRMTRSRVWALLGLALLVLLVGALPGLLVAAPIVAGLVLDMPALFVVAAVLGFAWFVYFLVVATRLTLAPAALVLERLTVVAAMRRSWRLVKGDSWRVFGILLLTQLLIAIVSGVVTVPFTFGSMALLFAGGGSAVLAVASALLSTVGQTVAATLTFPFTAGVYGLLYADRRMRAEAFDLTLQAAATGHGATPADDLWRTPSASRPGS
jgi:hypothetical protein